MCVCARKGSFHAVVLSVLALHWCGGGRTASTPRATKEHRSGLTSSGRPSTSAFELPGASNCISLPSRPPSLSSSRSAVCLFETLARSCFSMNACANTLRPQLFHICCYHVSPQLDRHVSTQMCRHVLTQTGRNVSPHVTTNVTQRFDWSHPIHVSTQVDPGRPTRGQQCLSRIACFREISVDGRSVGPSP